MQDNSIRKCFMYVKLQFDWFIYQENLPTMAAHTFLTRNLFLESNFSVKFVVNFDRKSSNGSEF
jgi:hypothetical protein